MRIYRALPALLALAALPAEAATTYYCSDAACGANTEAAFNAAFGALLTAGLTSTGTINFAGATSGTTVFNVGATATNFSGFKTTGASLLNVVGSQIQNTNSGAGTGIAITIPANVYAFGAHVTQSATTAKIYCFETTPANCDVTFILSGGTPGFVGIISDVALSNQQFRAPGTSNFLYMNDFEMAETPEVPTFVLAGAGLILFSLMKRKARRRARLVEQGEEQSLRC